MEQTWIRDEFVISTDQARLDLPTIHFFLSNCYWAKGIPFATMKESVKNSLCFGVYEKDKQIGFARVISDQATFAYVADVFILESYRGRELSKWLMQCILSHPNLQGLRRWLLSTLDAHGLYHQYGFEPLTTPERFLQINRPNIYIEVKESTPDTIARV